MQGKAAAYGRLSESPTGDSWLFTDGKRFLDKCMTDFIPPFPVRHSKTLGPLDTIKYAHRDILSIWPETAFDRQFIVTKIINRSIFIANHPDLVRHVLLTNHANYARKSALMRKTLAPLLGDGLFISDGATWQRHRDLEEPMFGPERLAAYADIMVDSAEQKIGLWSTFEAGRVISVLSEMQQLSAQIICRILFGERLAIEHAPTLLDHFSNYLAVVGQLDLNTFFGLPSWMPGAKGGKATASAKSVHAIVDKIIGEAEKSGDHGSLLAQFLAFHGQTASTNSLTREQIRNELIVLFMAGHGMTANTLAWVWYLVSQCPEVEGRLHQEIDQVLGERPATYADVTDLKYTRAVIEETMRLYPPLPILLREVIADDTIRKREVPAGSIMLVAPWLLHRHKQYWDKPDHFLPERFLDTAPRKPDPYVYIPFSGGPRGSLGKDFALVEMTLCLAMLARRFRLQVAEGHQVSHEWRLTLRPKQNLPMRITTR